MRTFLAKECAVSLGSDVERSPLEVVKGCTGVLSEIGTKLRESAVGQAGGTLFSPATLSSNDSEAL